MLSHEKDGCATSRLELSTHCGTHVDGPSHVVAGFSSVDQMNLSRFAGEALVVNVRRGVVHREDVEDLGIRDKCVLFKTEPRDASIAGDPMISEDCAKALGALRPRLVGIDQLSVDRMDDETMPVHRLLIAAGVTILEGLDLSQVKPGDGYFLVALPLRIRAGDGSPVRAALLQW